MIRYIINRVLLIIAVVFVASFIVYGAMDLAPGDAAVTALGDEASEEQLEAYREAHGLNDPLPIRYVRYMKNVILYRDFGTSAFNGESVWDLFVSKFGYTLELAAASILLTVVLSIPLGIIASVRQNSWVDTIASTVSFVGLAMPNFWVGLLLIIVFSVNLGWLPSNGATGWTSVILPAITCGTGNMAALTRTTRSAMLDVLHQDYLRTARSKGASESRVIWRHALRNAEIPIVTQIGNQCATLIGGALVTERVFSWPGVGNYLVTAILQSDYEVVTGFIIMIAIAISVVLLIVDIIYAYMDPRIKAQYVRE